MSSHLNRKLWRDLSRMKGQALAVALVMACGLAMLTMSRSLIRSLDRTRAEYYEHNRFASSRCACVSATGAGNWPFVECSARAFRIASSMLRWVKFRCR